MLLGQLVYSIYIFKVIITMLYIKVELYLGTDDGTESGGVVLPKIGVIVQETTPKKSSQVGPSDSKAPLDETFGGLLKNVKPFFDILVVSVF